MGENIRPKHMYRCDECDIVNGTRSCYCMVDSEPVYCLDAGDEAKWVKI